LLGYALLWFDSLLMRFFGLGVNSEGRLFLCLLVGELERSAMVEVGVEAGLENTGSLLP
jgi:hypothetical protein